jgi:hypothetical protein
MNLAHKKTFTIAFLSRVVVQHITLPLYVIFLHSKNTRLVKLYCYMFLVNHYIIYVFRIKLFFSTETLYCDRCHSVRVFYHNQVISQTLFEMVQEVYCLFPHHHAVRGKVALRRKSRTCQFVLCLTSL